MCGPGRNMVCSPNKSNRTFPQIWGSQLWCRNWDSHWNEIWKAVETNPIERFPKFEAHSEAPSSFEEVSWHFVKKKTPRSPFKSEFRCMGGLINRFLPVWCPISHSIWPLLFPHQLSGGCGTRLSIRRQDPNTYSDTEMRALSTSKAWHVIIPQDGMLCTGTKAGSGVTWG